MPVLTPIDEWVITAAEELWVETQLLRHSAWMAEIAAAEVAAAEAAEVALAAARTEQLVIGTFAVAIAATLTAIAIENQALSEAQTQAETEARLRTKRDTIRRRRTAICAKFCLEIIADRQAEMDKGHFEGKPLITEKSEKRKTRTFRSKA